jgi:hypothetical protein
MFRREIEKKAEALRVEHALAFLFDSRRNLLFRAISQRRDP